ncbi:MAG: signal peptidase II [Nitrospirae bacterium GWC2_57_9]|nr:MAG: signal peptidase II [Nitrospirae bacterium GWC2_57_9]
MRQKYLWAGSIIGAILILDVFTKYLVEKYIRLYDVVTVVPGFFNLTHVRNKGAAFSILASLPDRWRVLFFVTVTMIAVVVILILLRKTHESLLVIAFSLIVGGAVGNLIDRIRYGEVVDFIQWYVKSWYWPSFNVADSAISVGVALLAVDMLFFEKTRQKKISKS